MIIKYAERGCEKMRMGKKIVLTIAMLWLALTVAGCKKTAETLEDLYPVMESPALSVSTQPAEKTERYQPLNYEEMKGVWISYLEYGWMLQGKTEEEFRQNICSVLDDVVGRGLNTVIVQVRSHGDAYYSSSCYPWSQYVSGSVGTAPAFDPLLIMIEEAHSRSLSVHGWLNPYRLMKDEGMNLLSEEYREKQWYQSENWQNYMVKADDYWYLNPGNEEVQQLILDGVKELVNGYALDGIQIDDYFYTMPPDSFGQNAEQAQANTTATVQGIYQTIKETNPEVLFGVSPAGNYLEIPKSDMTQYTDLMTWCTQEGYLDYVVPQIYWDFEDASAPFGTVLDRWESLLQGSSCKLYVGLAAYKFADSEILQQQTDDIANREIADGYLYFRYDNLK